MENNRREGVIKLAARIAGLRENIAPLQSELQQAEAELDQLLGTSVSIAPPAPGSFAAQQFKERDEEKSLNQSIIDFLYVTSPEDADAEEVAKGLREGTNLTSVRSALARLANEERIRRTARGRYASVEEPQTRAS